MENLKTRDVVEFLLYNNIINIKSKKVLIAGVISTLIVEFILYKNFSMVFSSYILIDYILNMGVFILSYAIITSVLMHLYILQVEKFIELNIDILLRDVNLDTLDISYKKALEEKIDDENLLKYLQNYQI